MRSRPNQLHAEVEELARQMLACVPEAIVTYKRLLDAEVDVTPGEALRNSPGHQRHSVAARSDGREYRYGDLALDHVIEAFVDHIATEPESGRQRCSRSPQIVGGPASTRVRTVMSSPLSNRATALRFALSVAHCLPSVFTPTGPSPASLEKTHGLSDAVLPLEDLCRTCGCLNCARANSLRLIV